MRIEDSRRREIENEKVIKNFSAKKMMFNIMGTMRVLYAKVLGSTVTHGTKILGTSQCI